MFYYYVGYYIVLYPVLVYLFHTFIDKQSELKSRNDFTAKASISFYDASIPFIGAILVLFIIFGFMSLNTLLIKDYFLLMLILFIIINLVILILIYKFKDFKIFQFNLIKEKHFVIEKKIDLWATRFLLLFNRLNLSVFLSLIILYSIHFILGGL